MDMKKRTVYRNTFLICLVTIIVLFSGIKEAWAYFTTYARAEGGYLVRFGYETEIIETVSEWTKNVVIRNKEGSQPVYVRVKAFCGEAYNLSYSGENWVLKEDGYWYYGDMIKGGSQTDPILIKIGNIPEVIEDFEEFNVVVVYESTPVRYDQAGNPYADWAEGRR